MDPIEEAAAAVARGGVIVYPTDTLWGLGASISNEAGVRMVFELKARPLSEPLSVALADAADIPTYAYLTAAANRLLPLLPGPLTLVLEKRETVPDVVTAGSRKVGIRVPAHPECLRLLAATGPLTATSANLHGAPEPRTAAEARATFGDRVDFYLEAGSNPLGRPSTIVDASQEPVRILRQGALRESRIREFSAD